MKGTVAVKSLKIAGICLLSIFGVLVLAFLILSWTILSPSRLTSTTRKVLDKYAPCPVMIDKVELTLVKTYPFLAFRIDGLFVPDEMEESPLDTLLSVEKLFVQADIDTLISSGDIVVTNLELKKTQAGLFTAASGKGNLDFLMTADTAQVEEEPSEGIPNLRISLENAGISHLKASYTDLSAGIDAAIADFNVDMYGSMDGPEITAHVHAYSNDRWSFSVKDDTTDMGAAIGALSLKLDGMMADNSLKGNMSFSVDGIDANYGTMAANLGGIEAGTSFECSLDGNGLKDAGVRDLNVSVDNLAALMDGMEAGLAALGVKISQAGYDAQTGNVSLGETGISLGQTGFSMADSLGNRTVAGFADFAATLAASGNLDSQSLTEGLDAIISDITFTLEGDTAITAGLDDLRIVLNSDIDKEKIDAEPSISTGNVWMTVGNDRMVPGWPLSLKASIHTNPELSHVSMPVSLNVNGQQIGIDTDIDISNNMQDFRGYAGISARSLDIQRIMGMIPDSFKDMVEGISASGKIALNAGIRGSYVNGEAALQSAEASVGLDGVCAAVADTLSVGIPALTAKVAYPSAAGTKSGGESADIRIDFDGLDFTLDGEMYRMACLLSDVSLDARADGPIDSLDLNGMTAYATIGIGGLEASMDTISATLNDLTADVALTPNDGLPSLMLNLGFQSLAGAIGSMADAGLGRTDISAMARYDSEKEDILSQWDPRFSLKMHDSHLGMNGLTVELPQFDTDFSLGRFSVNDSRIVVDGSDISFWGDIYNIGAYLEDKGLLTGELFLESDHVDVNRLMALTSGIGVEEPAQEENTAEMTGPADSTIAEPFLVPKGIDLTLYTNFASIDFGDHEFNNLGGDVTIKDGTAVLKELGFSSDAARMQLTAIYTAPTVDSLFMAMDFHLLDIQIDELIDIVPQVDSVVPMLKSFDGQAQFHFAIESNLKPDYTPIYSTMLGAAAIEGKDLVVMDSEMFDGIKRKLLMGKNARNVIDSLDIELQIIRNKVTLFPFRIGMGKYAAVIGGRHNINKGLDCRYHISLVKTPLPIRLGVTVSGPLFDISEHPLKHIKLKRPEYKKLYEPEKRNDYEETELRLKSNVLNILRSNVQEFPEQF